MPFRQGVKGASFFTVAVASCLQAGPTISIADLLVLCELDQLRILEAAATGPYMKELLEPHPVVRAYLARVAKVPPSAPRCPSRNPKPVVSCFEIGRLHRQMFWHGLRGVSRIACDVSQPITRANR